jgi:glucose-1-phosphate cytidylyltransferase
MKVVILAGGLGTRLSEETDLKPKPMVEIGGKPILWHIMKIYSSYGFNEFVICCGYKGFMIKKYFADYFLHQSDVTIDLSSNKMELINLETEPWRITLADTGLNTMTGGRIKRIQKYTGNDSFMLTYGDGLSNVNIKELVDFHRKNAKLATLMAVQPSGRFGAVEVDENNQVLKFQEKPQGDGAFINAGFFVLEPKIFDYIKGGDETIWERGPLEGIAKDNQLMAFPFKGFWRPMDTLRDKKELEEMWNSGKCDWKIW